MRVQAHGGPIDGAILDVELEDEDEIILGIRQVPDEYNGPGVWRWCAHTKVRIAAYKMIGGGAGVHVVWE